MTQKIAIIDYGSGNIRSAAKALERAATLRGLDCDVDVVTTSERVRDADRIVLPGVGAFGDCKVGVKAVDGLMDTLKDRVLKGGVPFLGICVGMQLMADEGLEYGRHTGFGWARGTVCALSPQNTALKIPHMGWNALTLNAPDHPLLAGLEDGDHVYFVHSYAFNTDDPSLILASTDYGGPVTAMIARDNMAGTQFHPEKSQQTGLTLLGNFLEWQP